MKPKPHEEMKLRFKPASPRRFQRNPGTYSHV